MFVCVCVSICHMCGGFQGSEEGVGSSGAGAIGGCELVDMGSGNQT